LFVLPGAPPHDAPQFSKAPSSLGTSHACSEPIGTVLKIDHGFISELQWSEKRLVSAVASRLVLQNDVQGVDDTRQVTEDGQQNVDPEISGASSLKENSQRWKDDGNDDLADVGSGERHVD